MPTFLELIKQAETLATTGQVKSAIETFTRALPLAPDPLKKALFSYQIGALYWEWIGDGEKARSWFEETLRLWKEMPANLKSQAPFPAAANACENLMVLSLSFEEFFQRADELEKLAPQEDVLRQHVPNVAKSRENGDAWSAVMVSCASLYANPDPARNPGRYGSAACVLQLLLKNRRTLRLSRDNWCGCVIRYGAAAWLAAAKSDNIMRDATGRSDLSESSLITETAIPLVEEYASANPADDQARILLEKLRHPSRPDPEPKVFVPTAPKAHQPSQSQSLLSRGNPSLGYVLLVLGGFCFAISWKVREPWNISLIFAGIILVCGALAWFRRFFRSLRTELLGGCGLAWKSNSELDAAVKGTGIARLAFQLRSSEFEADGDICLVFTPISEVPKEKRYPSHLALRCVVGLTFPSAVAAVPDLSVRIGEKYSVNLGTGVPISLYVVTSRSEETTSLQLTSSEEEGIYRVFVTPYHIRVGKPLGGREFLPKIAAAFETLLNEPLVL